MKTKEYQPKTGAACGCKHGQERDNCPRCEGTGQVIDFAAIRARASAPAAAPSRAEMIAAILDTAHKSDLRLFGQCVERRECKGDDGQWHSLSVPRGVKLTEERRSYWVSMTREGTTVGHRYPTPEAWAEARQQSADGKRAEFEKQLQAMNAERIKSQFEYWVKPHNS